MSGFSFRRFLAVLRKEWIQIRRDPFTLRMIIALPVMQLFLFGYAINSRPQAPADRTAFGRPFQIRADDRRGAAEHRLLRHQAAGVRGARPNEASPMASCCLS